MVWVRASKLSGVVAMHKVNNAVKYTLAGAWCKNFIENSVKLNKKAEKPLENVAR